jgi:streptogramin lyase
MSALLACTAPNPAYRIEDPPRNDSSGMTALVSDAGRPPDSGRPPDAGPVGQGGATGCGKEQPELKDLVAVDSLAIDTAGNIYFSNDDGTTARIGKLPPKGAAANKQWLTIATGLPTRGMAIDSTLGVLYYTAGTPTAELQAVDLNAAMPRPRTISRSLIDPNDLVVGPDGNIYVSDQGDSQIYSFTPAGQKTKVTAMDIGKRSDFTGPAGLAFGPDGKLAVGVKGNSPLLRLTLAGGTEMGRVTFGPVNDWVNGLVYDERGRLYVATFDQTMPKDVIRLDGDNAAPISYVKAGRFSSMAFGRGELDCKDLYVTDASAGVTVRRMTTDAPGLRVR